MAHSWLQHVRWTRAATLVVLAFAQCLREYGARHGTMGRELLVRCHKHTHKTSQPRCHNHSLQPALLCTCVKSDEGSALYAPGPVLGLKSRSNCFCLLARVQEPKAMLPGDTQSLRTWMDVEQVARGIPLCGHNKGHSFPPTHTTRIVPVALQHSMACPVGTCWHSLVLDPGGSEAHSPWYQGSHACAQASPGAPPFQSPHCS